MTVFFTRTRIQLQVWPALAREGLELAKLKNDRSQFRGSRDPAVGETRDAVDARVELSLEALNSSSLPASAGAEGALAEPTPRVTVVCAARKKQWHCDKPTRNGH